MSSADRPDASRSVSSLIPDEIDVLDDDVVETLVEFLALPRPIEEVEELEARIKVSWRRQLERRGSQVSGQFAQFFNRIGAFVKYKSYARKYAMPFGYSLFDQDDGGGFSIQLHSSMKYEAFHILATKETSFVLLATLEEWREFDGDPADFWRSSARWPSFIFSPEGGDIIEVDGMGLVHTVVGCLLEEYATTSYDAVERLFDQNVGRSMSLPAEHRPLEDVLADVPRVHPRRRVARDPVGWRVDEQPEALTSIVDRRDLGLFGYHRNLDPAVEWAAEVPRDQVFTIVCLAGEVAVAVAGAEMTLEVGDTAALAPETLFRCTSAIRGDAILAVCEADATIAFADLR